MSAVEEQLRSELGALAATPPPPPDRVSAVRARVRRRTQRRSAAALALTVVSALGVAGLTVLPLGADRAVEAPLAGDPAEGPEVRVLRAEDLLTPMVQVHVDLGLPVERQSAVVDRELQALQPVPDNHSLRDGDARVVHFTRGIERQALEAFVDGVLADAVSPDVRIRREPGTSVELEVPLAPEVRAGLADEFASPPPPFELEAVLPVFGYGRTEDRLRLEYRGAALDQRRLDRVVELVARWGGAQPSDVAVRRLR